MAHAKTESEFLFETYLNQYGLKHDYEPTIPDKTRKLDYRIKVGDQSFFFEVEEFNQPCPVADSQKAIRDKINEAMGQFRQYKDYCCSLVLFSPIDVVGLTPDFVLGAMLGNVAVAWEVPADPAIPVEAAGRRFGSNGKMIRPDVARTPQNTTFSSIIVVDSHVIPQWRSEIAQSRLEKQLGRRPSFQEVVQSSVGIQHLFQDVVRVVVFENPDARKPLPRDLFVGQYDERWGRDADSANIVRVFAGTSIRQLESGGALDELSIG